MLQGTAAPVAVLRKLLNVDTDEDVPPVLLLRGTGSGTQR